MTQKQNDENQPGDQTVDTWSYFSLFVIFFCTCINKQFQVNNSCCHENHRFRPFESAAEYRRFPSPYRDCVTEPPNYRYQQANARNKIKLRAPFLIAESGTELIQHNIVGNSFDPASRHLPSLVRGFATAKTVLTINSLCITC